MRIPTIALQLETSLEYGRGLLRGVARYARLHGPWSLALHPGHFDGGAAGVAAADGVIARVVSLDQARAIRRSGVPAVVLEPFADRLVGYLAHAGCDEVYSDSPAITRMAVAHMRDRGFRQLGYCGYQQCPWSRMRERTVLAQAAEAGCTAHIYPHAQLHGDRLWDHDLRRLTEWLEQLPRPLGVIAGNDVCGRQVLLACERLGARVPDDVAVIGVDNDTLICELCWPPLSSVAVDVEAAGYAAAELLDERLSGRRAPGVRRQVAVKPLWVAERRSTDVYAQSDPLVADALRFISDHARNPIGVEDIARHLGICRRTLERRFRAALNGTVHERLAACRLERARRLLRETDLPVARVAEAAGFGGVKPMARLFRAEGTTPAACRSACE